MDSYNQDEQSLWYGYEIFDGENHLLGDEGDEAYFATKAGALSDALDYIASMFEDSGNDIPDDLTISIVERPGDGFYR